MSLKSALEDFEGTTLAAIPGLLGKLYYLAGLHDGHGTYSHWGMERVHGEQAARRAMGTSHAAVLTQVLRARLQALDEDLRLSASGGQVTPLEFLASLRNLYPRALTEKPTVVLQKHLKVVLGALSVLLVNQARASHRDASPPRPPVQSLPPPEDA